MRGNPFTDADLLAVLRAARSRVADAWEPTISKGMTGAVCDAFSAMNPGRKNDLAVFELLARIGDFLHGAAGQSHAKWEKAPGRTQAEVIAAFDRAIAAAEDHAQ